jgi:hypothetical protein
MARFHDYIAMVSPWQDNGRLDVYVSRCPYYERLLLVSQATLANKSHRVETINASSAYSSLMGWHIYILAAS